MATDFRSLINSTIFTFVPFFVVLFLEACVGGSDRPCHGNGMCDGDGTRGGNGKCSCQHGYTGEFCLDCIDGHFNEVKNDTFSLCTGIPEHTRTHHPLSCTCEESDEQCAVSSLNSSFTSSCRMPFILQNLHWRNQPRL